MLLLKDNILPITGHRESDLKLGQKLEILFLCLWCEPCSYQKHLHNRHDHRYENELINRFCSIFQFQLFLTLRSSARITPFLATEREDLRCMILSRHSDSHTGHRK